MYRSCLVSLAGYNTWVDLIILGMVDFDVILGMDWLSPYHVVLDYNAKTVTLAMPGVSRVEWKSVSGSYPSKVISFIRAQIMVERGCLSYLAFIRDTSGGGVLVALILARLSLLFVLRKWWRGGVCLT